MAQKIKIESGTSFNCFVPTCSSKKVIDDHPIHFFEVPQGNEGLRWKVSVNSNRTQHEKRIGILGRKLPATTLYCCELHFNIETDCNVTIDVNGSVECNIKPGVFPSIKPTRSRRLWEVVVNRKNETFQEMDCDNISNYWLQPIAIQRQDDEPATHTNDFISIVDMSAIICKNFNDDATQDADNGFDDEYEIKFTPMMPLTIELMRRKSLYYMGLEQRLFFRLLRIINRTVLDTTDSLMEMKIMLTLRKHRLNEEFEALGDLFDIDKTTAQRYYAESKDLVSRMYHSLTHSVSSPILQELNDVKSPLQTENHPSYEDEEDSEDSSSESEIKYKGYAAKDSDVDSDDFKNSDSETDYSDIDSEEFDNSEVEADDDEESKKNLVDCPICGNCVRWLDKHLKNIHWYPQYLNKTVCGLCLVKFPSNQKLREHQIADHNGNACKCDMCGKMFPKLSDTEKHILHVHLKVRPFLCHLCGASYLYENRLKTHIESAHSQIRKHECSLCDKKYAQATELRKHTITAHTTERPFTCRFDGCNKSFGRHGSRHTHEQMHKTKYRCEICSKDFSFKQNLQTHCKNIHGRNVLDIEKCKVEINK